MTVFTTSVPISSPFQGSLAGSDQFRQGVIKRVLMAECCAGFISTGGQGFRSGQVWPQNLLIKKKLQLSRNYLKNAIM
jgi:hypothetical protein